MTAGQYPARRWRAAPRALLPTVLLLAGLAGGDARAAQCEFLVKNEWNAGFTAELRITNDGAAPMDAWDVELSFLDGTQITGAWNTELSGSNPYVASHKSYNAYIAAGSTRSFGFNANKATPGAPAATPLLAGICLPPQGDSAPVAHATASVTSGTAPLTVQFDGSHSRGAPGDALSYHWDFGDGSRSTEPSPIKTFAAPGAYRVALVVSDTERDSAAFEVLVAVEAPPPETATCRYRRVNEWGSGFTGEVTITNEHEVAIDSWSVSLDYPDGSRLTGTWNGQQSGSGPYRIDNAQHNGRIRPGATVSFGFNAQRPAQNAPNVTPTLGGICALDSSGNRRPVAQLTSSVTSGEAPLTVSFHGQGSSDEDGDPLRYAWTFGDGGSSDDPAPSHVFTQPGSYQVALVVNDGELDSAPASVSITVTGGEPGPGPTYRLDAQRSSLHFVSTKKQHLLETHRFGRLQGEITETGSARLEIDLDSVDTGIAVRDQRLREHLFETALYGDARVSMNVAMDEIAAMPVGSSLYRTLSPSVELHGVALSVDVQLRISRLSATELLVQSTAPVLVHALDFDLAAGIETLRNLAGLDVISYAVPTNFHLLFTQQ